MRKRIIIINCIVVTISLIVMMLTSILVVSNENYNNAEKEVKNYLSLAKLFYNGSNEKELINEFKAANSDIRITIININGSVLADSNKELIEESHNDRLEIINIGKIYKRYSHTLKCNMLYIADLDDGNYIRVSFPIESVTSISTTFTTIGITVLVVLILVSILLIMATSKKALDPINREITNLSSLANESYKVNATIDDIPDIIEHIRISLDDKLTKISNQKEQIIDVLNTVTSGVLVLDNNGEIILINDSALNIFKMSYDNVIKREYIYLIRDINIQNLISNCINNKKNDEGILELDNKYYKVIIQHKNSSWINNGLIIVFRNITDQMSLDKTKREFFQNASHELKSPLTCIIGYQQLITEQIETDYDSILNYSSLTLKEAKRMNDIVVDMLNLARLERQEAINNEIVDCTELLNDIVQSLRQNLKAKGLELSLNIDDVKLNIDRKLADQLFRNLIENAIKYNNESGYIKITLSSKEFIVEDSGIGIPKEEQKHVFERFYRVDKAKSKSLGGTGLGLAIVKHICETYKYNIILKSKMESHL